MTVSLPLTFMLLHGKWSIGIIQNACWKFCQIGYQYLSRVIAELNLNSFNFNIFSSHFIEGLEDSIIREVFHICFSMLGELLFTET